MVQGFSAACVGSSVEEGGVVVGTSVVGASVVGAFVEGVVGRKPVYYMVYV